jgi:hypothetical protein
MKNLLIISAMLLAFLTNAKTLVSKSKVDSSSCLKIEGIVTNAEEGTDGECLVELICANETVEAVTLKEGKRKFRFILNKNQRYGIRISKKGYLSKLISVDTELTESTEMFGLYKFEFETKLLTEDASKLMNADALDFPIAIVQYDYEQESFSYNKEYTAYIKSELRKPNHRTIQRTNMQSLPKLSGSSTKALPQPTQEPIGAR